jgi:hypothetical protein
MDSQSSQIIWLVVPSGFSLDAKLAAELIGCVTALSAAVLRAGERSARCGSFPGHPDQASQCCVSAADALSDDNISTSPWDMSDAFRLLPSSHDGRRG